MVKQGGNSWNSNIPSKPGIKTRTNCKICGRGYKQEWTKANHEKLCAEYNKE